MVSAGYQLTRMLYQDTVCLDIMLQGKATGETEKASRMDPGIGAPSHYERSPSIGWLVFRKERFGASA